MIIILKSALFFCQCIFLPDVPPSPTLTASAQEVKEGTSVSLTCSAPASCLLHPPTLTWTPKLAHSQETLKENQDQTKVQISVLNFTASHLHHGKRITCTAVYWKHGGSNVSVNASLTAEVKYSPKDTRVSVSPSGPAPEGLTGSQETLIGHGRVLNVTTWIHNRVYFCKAENELGAGRSNNTHINVHYEEPLLLIVPVTVASLVLLCVLLFVIRFLNKRHKLRTLETAEENIYDNTSELGEEDAAHPLNQCFSTSLPRHTSVPWEMVKCAVGNSAHSLI
uniref:Ig-like domain-containing protein n=1 Tax=Oryzias latipes TaxID=8090 RepID=A0A3B3I249_ORYLA